MSITGGPPDLNGILDDLFPLDDLIPSNNCGILVASTSLGANMAYGTAGSAVPVSGPVQQFPFPTFDDALSYMDRVQQKSPPQIYNAFVEILQAFKHRCIDPVGVVTRVFRLFKSYTELIPGFIRFLPQDYRFEVQPNETGYLLQVFVPDPLGGNSAVAEMSSLSGVPNLTDLTAETQQPGQRKINLPVDFNPTFN